MMTFPLLVLLFFLVATATIGAALRTGRYFVFGMLGSTLLLALHGRVYVNHMSDDAFIYFRYAENLANGHGPVWNPGEGRVEGYTGILWLLPLTAAARLHLNLPETARYLGFAASVGTLALIFPLARALSSNSSRLAPVVACLALAAGPFATWSFEGQETPLFALLVLLGIWQHLREEANDGAAPSSGAIFAFAAMARPEGLLFVLISGLFKLLALAEPQPRRARIRNLLIWGSSFVALYGSYFGWRYSYYGYLLPNTFYVKVATGGAAYERGLNYLVDNSGQLALPVALLGSAVYAFRSRKATRSLYVVSLIAAWLVWVVFSGGDSLLAGRFIVPILPLLYLSAATGLVDSLELAWFHVSSYAVLTAVLAVALLAPLYNSSRVMPELRIADVSVRDWATVGRWMRADLPHNTTIGVSVAGRIPYYSKLPTLDMLGLNDTTIAHANVPTGQLAGHEKYDIEYVLRSRPDVIFIVGHLESAPLLTAQGYRNRFWVFPDEGLLVSNARTFALYVPASVDLGGGRWLNVLLSRTTASRLPMFTTGSE